jgi:hypothetical protein
MIGAIISGASSLLETGMGIYDRYKASQINAQRPTMDVPDAQKAALANAAKLAGTSARDSEMYRLASDQTRGNIAAGSNALQQQGGGGAAAGGIVDLYSRGQQNLVNVAIDAAKVNRQDQINYQNQLGKTAGYEQAAWKYNNSDLYDEQMQEKGMLEQQGNNSILGGLTNGAQTLQGMEDVQYGKKINADKEAWRKKQLYGE